MIERKVSKEGDTMAEVKQHDMDEDAWILLLGHVYNLSP